MTALAPSLVATSPIGSVSQRAASPDTIAAYALAFRLLLAFAAGRTGSPRPRTRGHPTVASPSAHPAESSEGRPLLGRGIEDSGRPKHSGVFRRSVGERAARVSRTRDVGQLVDYCRRC